MNNNILTKYNEEPKTWLRTLAISLLIFLMLLYSSSAIKFEMGGNGLQIVKSIFKGIFTPSPELFFNFSTEGIPYLILQTIAIALLGTMVGLVWAVPLAFLSSSNVVPTPVAVVFRTFIMAIRTVPAFVYGLMFIRVTGPGPFAGLMTMSVTSIGMLTKLFIENIEDIDHKIIESLDALGCTTFQKIRYGILPQLMAGFISTFIYRFDLNFRDAPILGMLGAGGIGAPLMFAMSAYRWNEVGAILLGIIIFTLIIEAVSTRIRKYLATGV